jgi:hypothetical protein
VVSITTTSLTTSVSTSVSTSTTTEFIETTLTRKFAIDWFVNVVSDQAQYLVLQVLARRP